MSQMSGSLIKEPYEDQDNSKYRFLKEQLISRRIRHAFSMNVGRVEFSLIRLHERRHIIL